MENFEIYKDIAERTGGDIYIGVVGPVRTGKSTFITKLMEKLVIPNISNKFQKQLTSDDMPQSADGKTIMTTQPKFVPSNAVKINLKNKVSANIRLVDCVGYLIDGAFGSEENDKPRMVRTPWSDEEIPFEKAAEIGTEKVITDYSTLGIIVTTDGSIGEIPRESYVQAEEKTVNQLKKCKKPFIIVLNTSKPQDKLTLSLVNSLEDKYGVFVIACDVLNIDENTISDIMGKMLMDFPMNGFNVDIPDWLRVLPSDNPIIEELLSRIKKSSNNIIKMRDFSAISDTFTDSERYDDIAVQEIDAGRGICNCKIKVKDGLFYKVLSEECDESINNEYDLISYIKLFSQDKKRFFKIKEALSEAENSGYGVVVPTVEEMNLEEPVLVKKGGQYGVKLKASAPSLHIMKVDVETEVSPIVGNEKQGEDLVNYLMGQFEDDPNGIWETNMFGKSLHDLVKEGLSNKLVAMPKDTQVKMRKTLGRIVNENRGGILCILL